MIVMLSSRRTRKRWACKPERSGRRVGSSRSSGTIANSVATTRELSLRSEQLRVLLVHRTNIPAQFLSSAAEQSIAHGTLALPLPSQSAPKPPLMAGARLPCRRRHPRLVARPAPSAPARWPRAASAETAAQLLGGRSGSRLPRHRHPTARCPNGPPTANRPLTRSSGPSETLTCKLGIPSEGRPPLAR